MNLGYGFYHDSPGNNDVDFGRGIIQRSQNIDLQQDLFRIDGATCLELEILYPGLATGLGYQHPKLKDTTDDFALGFMFDHTTGLPYIPGSSIKGVLRSPFPKTEADMPRLDFINGILDTRLEFAEMTGMETRIFGNRAGEKRQSFQVDQDVFYDAFVSRANGPLFAEDYITPHEDAVTNPNPIRFLKLAPGTRITFQFGLSPHRPDRFPTPADRIRLYTEILVYLGCGAKTNVGYGQFDEDHGRAGLEAVLRSMGVSVPEKREPVEPAASAREEKKKEPLSPVDQIFEDYRQPDEKETVWAIISALERQVLLPDPPDLAELASRLRERMEELNIWTKQKKRKKDRVRYLKSILEERGSGG